MFEPTSRYSSLPIKTWPTPAEGDPENPDAIRYVARRFIPPPESIAVLSEHRVAPGERLDHITARYFGDSAQFWRVADANAALRLEELTAEPGLTIIIPQPQA